MKPLSLVARIGSAKLLALGALGLAAISVTTGISSLALFTDQQTSNNSFSSGTIKLDGTQIAGLSLTLSAMMPGDSVTDDVVVSNIGSGQLRYAVAQTSTDDSSPNGPALYGAITLTVKTIDVTTPGTPCDNFDGTQLYSSLLSASGNVVGDPTQGSQTGDRTLAPSASETLCFKASLPLSTGNTFQGATSTTSLAFDAEQTSNN